MSGGPSITEVVVWGFPLLLWPLSGLVIATWLRRHGRFDAHVDDDEIDRANRQLIQPGADVAGGATISYGCLALLAGPLLLLVWLLPRRR